MKNILIVIVLNFFGLCANSENLNYFLSYEDYSRLTFKQKTTYIEGLQKYVVDLSANSNFTSNLSKLDENQFLRIVASNLINEAYADYEELDATCKVGKEQLMYMSLENLSSISTQTANCTEISVNGSPQIYRPVVAERLRLVAEELNRRIENGSLSRLNKKDFEYAQEAAAGLSYNLKRFNSLEPNLPYNNEDILIAQKLDTIIDQFIENQENARYSKIKSIRIQANPAPKTNEIRTEKPELSTEPNKQNYRCISAGFIIPSNKSNMCLRLKKLPEDFNIDGIQRNQFVCLNSNEILCNPLLFGYKDCEPEVVKNKDLCLPQPLCVSKSETATKNCYDKSKSENSIENVIKIWNTPNGRSLYTSFIHSLDSLCNKRNYEKNPDFNQFSSDKKQRIFSDIKKTCETSYLSLKEVLTRIALTNKKLKKGEGAAK